MPSFDIRHSLFNIYPPLVDSLFKVSFIDQTARLAARGPPSAETLNL
jgi:hypothetical protein